MTFTGPGANVLPRSTRRRPYRPRPPVNRANLVELRGEHGYVGWKAPNGKLHRTVEHEGLEYALGGDLYFFTFEARRDTAEMQQCVAEMCDKR